MQANEESHARPQLIEASDDEGKLANAIDIRYFGRALSRRTSALSTRPSCQRKARVDLSVFKQSDVQVIRLRGRLTLGQPVDSFRQAIEHAFENGDHRVLVNLAEVPMIDSSGIGALVRCHTTARQKGGNIKLVQPQTYTVKTLKMVGLLDLFEVYESEEEAAASFA